MKRVDCLCAGIVVADFLCEPVAQLPVAGGLVMTEGISLAIGGCASNVAVDLARLGRAAAVVGRIGDDPSGRYVRDALALAEVDVTHLRETEGAGTSGTLVINVRGEDRRFIHAAGANAAFTGDELSTDQIRAARVLYLGGFCLMPRLDGERAAGMFRAAREAGVTTVLDVVVPDPAGWWPQVQKVLPFTDVFLPNTDEAALLTGLHDPRRQAEEFIAAGTRTAVVTCGGDGLLLAERNRRLRARSFAVEFVDGTGSGDAFAAGYIDGLLDGLPAERCIEIGSALGASCVRRPGATTGVFTRNELVQFLTQQRLEIETLV